MKRQRKKTRVGETVGGMLPATSLLRYQDLKCQEDSMDLSPTMWVIIILIATAISGAIMLWSTGPRNKKR